MLKEGGSDRVGDRESEKAGEQGERGRRGGGGGIARLGYLLPLVHRHNDRRRTSSKKGITARSKKWYYSSITCVRLTTLFGHGTRVKYPKRGHQGCGLPVSYLSLCPSVSCSCLPIYLCVSGGSVCFSVSATGARVSVSVLLCCVSSPSFLVAGSGPLPRSKLCPLSLLPLF